MESCLIRTPEKTFTHFWKKKNETHSNKYNQIQTFEKKFECKQICISSNKRKKKEENVKEEKCCNVLIKQIKHVNKEQIIAPSLGVTTG